MTLRHCVREAQNGNHEATLFLLGQFSPLFYGNAAAFARCEGC